MPTDFLSLPRELRQAILLLSLNYNFEDFVSCRGWKEHWVKNWVRSLRRVASDIAADVDYVEVQWLKEIDDSEEK